MTDKDLSKAAKEYFAQIRKTDRLIQRLDSTVSTLRSNLTSQNYALNPNKVQTSGPKDTLSETVAKIIDFEADINNKIDELVDLKREAFQLINKVSDFDQRGILIGRYVELKTWETLSIELNFSIQWLYELHGRGLIAFATKNADFLNNRVKKSEIE